jgi:ABC-type Fe3+/spermidine/putrescine transport system ATPase subunit
VEHGVGPRDRELTAGPTDNAEAREPPPAGAEPALDCRTLRKRYSADAAFALGGSGGGVSFAVQRGELFALVGPSGCGKTTILRIVGGFVAPDYGRVFVDRVDITGRPPYKRPTNTVFQSYALFPHLSVGSNVAFGLQMERMRRRERRARVAEALRMVGLDGFEARRVSELSGGQQQRAALARAIAKRPALLLLDEPLGALDLNLRKQMQDELVGLKHSMATTFVHVTHDQEEACAIADRIGVMKDGEIVQVDEPLRLFQRPATTFVASFLDVGSVVRGTARKTRNVLEIQDGELTIRTAADSLAPERVAAVIPPDKIRIADEQQDGANAVRGRISRVVFTGTSFRVYVALAQGDELELTVSAGELERGKRPLEPGRAVTLAWRPEDVILVRDDGDASPANGSPSGGAHEADGG